MTQRGKDTLTFLINKELEQEYSYQLENKECFGECDLSLIKDLINLEKELMYNRAKGIDKIVWGQIIEEDIKKYIKSLEEE